MQCYIPPLLSQFSFLQFSVQLERCSPPCHPTMPRIFKFLFSIARVIRNFLVITYLDNFRKLVILFSAILVVPLTSTIEGRCLRPSAKMFFGFQSQKCKTFVGKWPRKMMLETRLITSFTFKRWRGCMCSYNSAKTVIYPSYAMGIWDLKAGWFPEHRTVSNIIFLGCFPAKVLRFM